MKNDFESKAMLGNLIAKLRETKTHAEIIGWLMAEAIGLLKIIPDTESKQDAQADQVQDAPAAIQGRKGDPNPTGPVVKWKPPVGGFYRHDGRFVKDETWKPARQPTVEESKPSVPDVLTAMQQGRPVKTDKHLIAVTLPNGMQKHYEWSQALQDQLEKEKREARQRNRDLCSACQQACR